MQRIFRRVEAGETIRVSYRSRPSITMRATPRPHRKEQAPEPGSPEAMQDFLQRTAALRAQAKPNSRLRQDLAAGKTYKEIYWEDMAKKYGVK